MHDSAWYLPQRNVNTCLPQTCTQRFMGSIIHNSQKVKAIQMSVNRKDKQNWYLLAMEYYSAIKRMRCWYMLIESWKQAKWKEKVTKDQLDDSIDTHTKSSKIGKSTVTESGWMVPSRRWKNGGCY